MDKYHQAAKEQQASMSVFHQSEESQLLFVYLQDLLKGEMVIESELELEQLIRSNDQLTRYKILKGVLRRKNPKQKFKQLQDFARDSQLDPGFFTVVELQEYAGKTEQLDLAVKLIYQGYEVGDIAYQANVDMVTVDQLQQCSGMLVSANSGDTTSAMLPGQVDYADQFARDLRDLYVADAARRIENLHELARNNMKAAAKFTKVTLREFRSVTLLKKEDLALALVNCSSVADCLQIVRPLLLSYIQCTLPLEQIVTFIQKKFRRNFPLSAQDLFDLFLLESDEDVRALMLERYALIYPIPLLITDYSRKQLELISQLAYFIKPCKTMLSYGLLRASITKCGKSTLIDEIFSTDFTCNHKGNFEARAGAAGNSGRGLRSSAYELGRLDIQLPRNIDSYEAQTQWQIIDASRFTESELLDFVCWKVNVLLVHMLAIDLVETPHPQLTQLFKPIQDYNKKVVIFVRDIDQLKGGQADLLEIVLTKLRSSQGCSNFSFVKIQSILMKEQNRMKDFASTKGESFESTLNSAIETLKAQVIKFDVPAGHYFEARSIKALHAQVPRQALPGQDGNQLQQDLTLVQKLIDLINSELSKQLKSIQEQVSQKKELEKDSSSLQGLGADLDSGSLTSEASTQLPSDRSKGLVSSPSHLTEPPSSSSELISDRILFYYSKYFKQQKYQNEVNALIYDQEYLIQGLPSQDKMEQNQQKGLIIQDRSIKMKKLVDELLPFAKSEARDQFLAMLKSKRSLLLVWLLSERLHHESEQNPLWRRFLLNQELFEKNVQEGTSLKSEGLDILELQKLLGQDSSAVRDQQETQLSVFDFFRELVLTQFYSQNHMHHALSHNTTSDVHKTTKQKLAETQRMNEVYQNNLQLNNLRRGFSNYVQSGESVELIDGENIRIHDEELTVLMADYISELQRQAGGQHVRLFVVSQIGKQSVGKSFLFNHMFKTKFLNRSGRCTQGINIAIRDLNNGSQSHSKFQNHDKLVILDTEGLGSLDKVKRLKGKDMNFDRVMVLFCLTVSNALIITLKTEIDNETADLISVCCWALQNLKINKTSPPHIFFVLNQQADTNVHNYMRSLNSCIEQITENPLYSRDQISQYIHISTENFIVLPTAFNQEPRNFENLYDFPVQRSIIKSQFTEKCQDLGLKIISTIQNDPKTTLRTFDQFMKIAGDSFRTIASFPELLRFKNVNEFICNKTLREKVYEMINFNQIITADYQKINHGIITQIHNLDIKLVKNTEDFVHEMIQPLSDRYHDYYTQLKQDFVNYSQAKQFADHPDVVELNLQILNKQCIKQFQYFKNIITDLINERNHQKQQKSLEDKVNELIRRNTDTFIKTERHKWKNIFDQLWDDASKQVIKHQVKQEPTELESFQMLLREQYALYSLDSIDNHRMPLTKIYDRYIQQFIVQSSQQEESKQSSKPTRKLTQAVIVQSVIDQLAEDILNTLKGKRQRIVSAGENSLVFFEANTKNIPPGRLADIEGKSQKAPVYLSIDQITEVYLLDEEEREARQLFRGKSQKQDNVLLPSSHLSDEVHPLICRLIGKSDEEIINKTSYDSQAIKLAQTLPSMGDRSITIWEDFTNSLTEEIKFEIWQSQQSKEAQRAGTRGKQGYFNQFRSQDTKNFRITMAVAQKYMQEVDYELAYIWVSLNTHARIYLNTLGFFLCLQNRIVRDKMKVDDEVQQRELSKLNFFTSFEKNMLEKQKQRLDGLTEDEMKTHDEFKSMLIGQLLGNQIENEAKNLTYNFTVSQLQSVANTDLSNRSLVQQINRSTRSRIFAEGAAEATSDSDPGVRYIVDYHGLLDQTFNQKWDKIELSAYDEAKVHFKEEVNIALNQLVNFFSHLLAEMRNLLRTDSNLTDKILLEQVKVEDCFNTHEIFKLYEMVDKFGSLQQDEHLQAQEPLQRGFQGELSQLMDEYGGYAGSSSRPEEQILSFGDEQRALSITATSKKSKSRTKSLLQQQSFYNDMNMLDEGDDISVDSVDILQSSHESEDDFGSHQVDTARFLQSKLNLELFKIPVKYLKWYMDPSHTGGIQIRQLPRSDGDPSVKVPVIEYDQQKYEIISKHTYPLFGRSKLDAAESSPVFSESSFKKVRQAGLFDSSKYEVYNLYRFLSRLLDTLQKTETSLKLEEFQAMIYSLKLDLEQKSKGCQERCPACNKYCEEAFNHMAEEGVQSPHTCSQYGHQFFSMGGKMWAEKTRECILVQCHDQRLNDFQSIKRISGQREQWADFKARHSDWLWDDGILAEHEFGIDFMIQLHNKCGRRAFKHYYRQNDAVDIRFRFYQPSDSYSMRGLQKSKQICFVVDGTKSMSSDIQKVRVAIKNFTKTDVYKEIAVVIYRDHDCEEVVDFFPKDKTFTVDTAAVLRYLNGINTQNARSKSHNEAALDGLAAAASFNWGRPEEQDLLVIHIADAMPHGNWPEYSEHHELSGDTGASAHCCCCSSLCSCDWDRDVFTRYKELKLQYHSIFTHEKDSVFWFSFTQRFNEGFEQCMQQKLGKELCPPSRFSVSEKNLVDVKINDIMISERN